MDLKVSRLKFWFWFGLSEAYSKLSRTFKKKLFPKAING